MRLIIAGLLSVAVAASAAPLLGPSEIFNYSATFENAYAQYSLALCGASSFAQVGQDTRVLLNSGGKCQGASRHFTKVGLGNVTLASGNPQDICYNCEDDLRNMTQTLLRKDNCTLFGSILEESLQYDNRNKIYCADAMKSPWVYSSAGQRLLGSWATSIQSENPGDNIYRLNATAGECVGASVCVLNKLLWASYAFVGENFTSVSPQLSASFAPCNVSRGDLEVCGPSVFTPAPTTTGPTTIAPSTPPTTTAAPITEVPTTAVPDKSRLVAGQNGAISCGWSVLSTVVSVISAVITLSSQA